MIRNASKIKKHFIHLFIIILTISCSTSKVVNNSALEEKEEIVTYDFAGIVTDDQLHFVRENYNWNNEKILIVNYSQPTSSCHFNNNKINNQSKKWWKDFYSQINTEDCLLIEVLSNGERVKKKLDNVRYFDDKNDFLLTNFFSRKKSCFGVLAINSKGYYIQFNGHYSEQQVAKYIENLR